LSAKVAEGEEAVRRETGLRDSFSMVAKRPNCFSSCRRSLNVEMSSWDALRDDHGQQDGGRPVGCLEELRISSIPEIPDCILTVLF
jgi:hypothetical protein